MRLDARRSLLVAALCVAEALAACNDSSGPDSPAMPTNLQTQATGANSIRLTFSGPSGASGFVIDRAIGPTGAFARLTPSPVTAVTYDDVGLQPNTQYAYRVAAVIGTDTSAFTLSQSTTTLATGAAGTFPLTGTIAANRTLTADTLYALNGYVKVTNGATLTIQPGTRILGGNAAGVGGALFVYRGAKIVANGTKDAPIVFTSSRAADSRAPGDWGGLVIVGNATVNRTGGSVLTESPAETQARYNDGTDDNDNSGVLRYVRIEYAGFAVSQDNELNSFSFYAVGKGTTLEYLQSLAGLDDSFEWFGGTVDGRYLVSYEAGDDHFDWAEGYRGRNQFLLALQTTVLTPNAGGSAGGASVDPQIFEGDGCNGAGCGSPTFDSAPYSMPVFANFTVIGTGPGVIPAGGGFGLLLRRGTGGTFVNGVVARMPSRAITARDAETGARITADSLSLRSLFLVENTANFDLAGEDALPTTSARRYAQAARFANAAIDSAAAGTTASSVFAGVPAAGTAPTAAPLDFTPAASAPAPLRTGGLATFTGVVASRTAGYFGGTLQGTSYRGAADPAGANKWWEGWTVYARR